MNRFPIQNNLPGELIQNSNPEGINQYSHGHAGIDKEVASAKTGGEKLKALYAGTPHIGRSILEGSASITGSHERLASHIKDLLDGMKGSEIKAAAKDIGIHRPLTIEKTKTAIHEAITGRLGAFLRAQA